MRDDARVRELLATLGLAEIIRILIQNSQPLGGALGLTLIPKYTNFAWLWGVAILSIVLGFNFMGDGLRDAADPYS